MDSNVKKYRTKLPQTSQVYIIAALGFPLLVSRLLKLIIIVIYEYKQRVYTFFTINTSHLFYRLVVFHDESRNKTNIAA